MNELTCMSFATTADFPIVAEKTGGSHWGYIGEREGKKYLVKIGSGYGEISNNDVHAVLEVITGLFLKEILSPDQVPHHELVKRTFDEPGLGRGYSTYLIAYEWLPEKQPLRGPVAAALKTAIKVAGIRDVKPEHFLEDTRDKSAPQVIVDTESDFNEDHFVRLRLDWMDDACVISRLANLSDETIETIVSPYEFLLNSVELESINVAEKVRSFMKNGRAWAQNITSLWAAKIAPA